MPGKLRQSTPIGFSIPSRSLSVPPVVSEEARSRTKHFLNPRAPEKQKKRSSTKHRSENPHMKPQSPYDRWHPPHSHYSSWTVPVKESGYTEQVATPWYYDGRPWDDRSSSSVGSLNGWTPWASWQRAHAKTRSPYEGRTFEAVPVTSLNLDDHHAPQTRSKSKSPTTPTPTRPKQYYQDDGIRVRAVSFADEQQNTLSPNLCFYCSSYAGSSSSHTSTSAGSTGHRREHWIDSDRSFVDERGLGPAVSQGLMHYPPTRSLCGRRYENDGTSVRSWDSDWKLRHLC